MKLDSLHLTNLPIDRGWLRLLVAGAMALGLSAVVFAGMMRLTDGEFVYPLDDSYIHISLAKNLSENGTWGLAPGEWAFCSSSPLWTLILSGCFRLFGVVEWIPLVLSVLCNVGAAITACRLFSAFPLRRTDFGRLAALMLVTPFAITGALGMEHALHVWLTLAVCGWLVKGGRTGTILSLAFLSTASRFESLFVLLPVAVVVGLGFADRAERTRGRALLLGLGIALAAVAPVGLYGWYAVAHGGHFLPVSLLLKGNTGGLVAVVDGIIGIVTKTSAANLHLRLTLALLAVLACLRKTPRGIRWTAVVLFVATGGHLVFAQTGWLYRYEAYLVASSAMLALIAAGALKRSIWYWLVLTPTMAFLALRGGYASYRAMTASRDIQSQQVALAKMFASLPDRGTLALNDVGYLSLHAGRPVLDLCGLGSPDVAELKIQGKLDKSAIDALFRKHQVKYVAVFDTWFPRATLPDDLTLIKVHHTPGNRTCGYDRVHVYERRNYCQ